MKYHNPFMSSVSFLIATIVSLFSVPALASDLSQYPDADSAAIGSAILMATLAFETEGLDLDTGTVEASDIPGTTNGTDIRVAYNALRSPGAVVVPGNTQGIELAFVSGVAFDGVTAASVTDLTFSTEPVDAPFSANDTVVVRTDTGVLFKLGNASESDNSVTFNYAGLYARRSTMKNAFHMIFALSVIGFGLLFGSAVPADTPTANEVAKLVANDGARFDYFGYSVDVNGDTAVIGAYRDDDEGYDSGSAYVFTLSGGTWSLQQKLTSGDDDAARDAFGYSVSIDGDTVLIGARLDDDNGYLAGSAYVFTRSGGVWSQQQKLTASDGGYRDYFGASVEIDGDTAVIGAYGDGWYTGSAYVFTRSGVVWSQQQKLTASDGEDNDFFGTSVSVDGETAVIGAGGHASSAGSAYVFTRSGVVWSQQQKLTASDGEDRDFFGISVSIDGDTAVIGAHRDDDNGADAGSAYVFMRSGGVWSQQQKLTASDGADGDTLGWSVDVDGDTAVISAPGDDNDNGRDVGSAYVFTRSGQVWIETLKLLASDGQPSDNLGSGGGVGVSDTTVVAGAHLHDVESATNAGATYVFSSVITDDEGPVTSNVVVSVNPVAAGASLTITANVDDTNTGGSNIASASYTLNDGASVPMAAADGDFDAVAEDVTATVYGLAVGLYDVCVSGTDIVGNTGLADCTLLAVYDPDAGFVTGGGWIDSPRDAYVADPSLTGKANFGFVSKYKTGATAPTGSTQFTFSTAGLSFHSDTYDWLVVNQHGKNAQFKGVGTINGQPDENGQLFGFMVWAGDDEQDTFRIRIWSELDDGVEIDVYDNGFGQPIGGGSIMIHTGGNTK